MFLLMFLPFLKNTLRLSKIQIRSTINTWNSVAAFPTLTEEELSRYLDMLYKQDFKGRSGKVTKEFIKKYGYVDFTHIKLVNKLEIYVSNEILDHARYLDRSCFNIYLAFLFLDHKKKISNTNNTISKVEIVDFLKITDRTFTNCIKTLVNRGLITKQKTCTYYVTPYISSTKGFTRLDTQTLLRMLEHNNSNENLVYFALRKTIQLLDICYITQLDLANMCGISNRSSISKITDSLHSKNFIEKTTIVDAYNKNLKHSQYAIF